MTRVDGSVVLMCLHHFLQVSRQKRPDAGGKQPMRRGKAKAKAGKTKAAYRTGKSREDDCVPSSGTSSCQDSGNEKSATRQTTRGAANARNKRQKSVSDSDPDKDSAGSTDSADDIVDADRGDDSGEDEDLKRFRMNRVQPQVTAYVGGEGTGSPLRDVTFADPAADVWADEVHVVWPESSRYRSLVNRFVLRKKSVVQYFLPEITEDGKIKYATYCLAVQRIVRQTDPRRFALVGYDVWFAGHAMTSGWAPVQPSSSGQSAVLASAEEQWKFPMNVPTPAEVKAQSEEWKNWGLVLDKRSESIPGQKHPFDAEIDVGLREIDLRDVRKPLPIYRTLDGARYSTKRFAHAMPLNFVMDSAITSKKGSKRPTKVVSIENFIDYEKEDGALVRAAASG